MPRMAAIQQAIPTKVDPHSEPRDQICSTAGATGATMRARGRLSAGLPLAASRDGADCELGCSDAECSDTSASSNPSLEPVAITGPTGRVEAGGSAS